MFSRHFDPTALCLCSCGKSLYLRITAFGQATLRPATRVKSSFLNVSGRTQRVGRVQPFGVRRTAYACVRDPPSWRYKCTCRACARRTARIFLRRPSRFFTGVRAEIPFPGRRATPCSRPARLEVWRGTVPEIIYIENK